MLTHTFHHRWGQRAARRACGILILLCCLCSERVALHAQEVPAKKYTLSIAAIFKDEAPYFKEWIEYHRLVGVEHFYLYNNGSEDDFKEVLSPYIADGLVTVIDWPDKNKESWGETKYAWVNQTQVPAYDHACTIAALGHTEWLALIDVDEFLVPVSADTFTAILEKYRGSPGVMAFWHVFGTSGVEKLKPNTLLIESLHRTCPPDHSLQTQVVKSIVRPERYRSFSWPPHACMYEGRVYGTELPKSEAQINHYINRTMDYFYKSKVKKKEKMDNRKISEEEIREWLLVGNEVEDNDKVIHRYIPQLRQRMGFDP